MKKLKAIVEFEFYTNEDIEKAKKSIKEQLYTDLNYYFQYEKDSTMMQSIDVKEILEEGDV